LLDVTCPSADDGVDEELAVFARALAQPVRVRILRMLARHDAEMCAAIAVATLPDSGLSPAAVIDLVPVKPLAGQEAAMTEAHRDVLPALHAKIRSAPVPAR
jgi:hypothetical protein